MTPLVTVGGNRVIDDVPSDGLSAAACRAAEPGYGCSPACYPPRRPVPHGDGCPTGAAGLRPLLPCARCPLPARRRDWKGASARTAGIAGTLTSIGTRHVAKKHPLRLHIIARRVGLSGELPRAAERNNCAADAARRIAAITPQTKFLDGDGTMTRLLTLLAAATLAATTTGCGCCGWCWPKAPTTVVATPAPACPPPVAADPCTVPPPTTTTYGYAPATGW